MAAHELLGRQAAEQGRGVDVISMEKCDNSPMEITQQCVVALTWTLKDTLGEVLDELE